jgi:ethanolamine utilization protein EutP (predicted NTPase)
MLRRAWWEALRDLAARYGLDDQRVAVQAILHQPGDVDRVGVVADFDLAMDKISASTRFWRLAGSQESAPPDNIHGRT